MYLIKLNLKHRLYEVKGSFPITSLKGTAGIGSKAPLVLNFCIAGIIPQAPRDFK
jgi:hypothetical protein